MIFNLFENSKRYMILCHNPHDKGFLKEYFSVHCQEIYDEFEIVTHVFAHNFCTGSWKIFGMSQKK